MPDQEIKRDAQGSPRERPDSASRLPPAHRVGRAFRRISAFLDERLTPLQAPPAEGLERRAGAFAARGITEAVTGGGWNTPLRAGFRRNLVNTYRSRAGNAGPSGRAMIGMPLAPSPATAAPGVNWVPIGPSVLRRGQAGNRPAVSGRVDGIAVAAGGQRVYVASANGGVWRSDDGGAHWRPTMDGLESEAGSQPADSMACGAIAIEPADPDRVYVGTGEPFGALDSYFGVGPLVSSDGGASWEREASDVNSPPLDGTGFFRLAVDPAVPGRVVAASRNGIYRREPDGARFVWVRKRGGVATSAVASNSRGATTFFAALTPGGVFMSGDGDQWDVAGTGFPGSTGVVVLATRPANPFPLYALVVDAQTFNLMSVLRLDAPSGAWLEVRGAPADLFGDPSATGQGWYDAAMAVAPDDESLVFLGGGANSQFEGAGFYRCRVTASGTPPHATYSMQAEWIGSTVHPDIHALEFTPGNPGELWIGCDGGVFMTDAAATAKTFSNRNAGLATVTMNRLALHPTEDGVLFCGVQDNGTVRYVSSEAWLHSAPGDGGAAVIHPADPFRVMRTYIFNSIDVTTDGGRDYDSWISADVPIAVDPQTGDLTEDTEFYAPLAGSPDGLVAFGSARPWISDFGAGWRSIPSNDPDTDRLPDTITALFFFKSATLYAGTRTGGVFRYDLAGGAWTRRRISKAPLLRGRVTGFASDPSDATGNSIYLCFGGGPNDFRHVWHFDGSKWEARSGPGPGLPSSLLAVQHNAIVTDPDKPTDIYAAADLGIWRSSDGGRNWRKFSDGLPEAAVIDLRLHPKRRILWAATHGRGVFERPIDATSSQLAEFWIRDTLLDTGRRATTEGLPDPTDKTRTLSAGDSPDIKVDPQADGSHQTESSAIDFLTFEDGLEDRSAAVPAAAPQNAVHRIYIQVHNRGRTPADARVMLLAGPGDGVVPDLPANYDASVQNGRPISGAWTAIGTAQLKGIVAGVPGIAAMEVRASDLAAPGAAPGKHLTLLALVHSEQDPFASAVLNAGSLIVADRKAAAKRLTFI